MGEQLEKQNNEIQSALREIDVAVLQKDIPEIENQTLEFVKYRYYVGLGLAAMVLLILFCFIMGLFYGMCGSHGSSHPLLLYHGPLLWHVWQPWFFSSSSASSWASSMACVAAMVLLTLFCFIMGLFYGMRGSHGSSHPLLLHHGPLLWHAWQPWFFSSSSASSWASSMACVAAMVL